MFALPDADRDFVELIDEIQSAETLDGYRFFHFRGPDGNVYAMVEGSSALRR
jgi:hypothetical protein